MQRRIDGVKQGARRRWRALAALSAAVAALSIFAIAAYAVHDDVFQLDGDVSASTTTNVGGKTQTVDWDSLFDSSGAEKSLPAGFTASDFQRDFKTNANGTLNTSDDSTFATGSKDILPISGWQCNRDNNVNNKIDISNAYSAAYKNAAGDDILYFALERSYNGGDANVGFWFMQGAVGCTSPGGAVTFSGAHTDGDLLIVSAFTKGGDVSTIDVYRWNGGANGSLGTTPVVHGVDCKVTSGNDTACATVNGPTNGTAGTITTPWLTNSSKLGVGHSLPIASFFEGGLNLTKANLAGKCFNSFLGDTRSSQSLTATLFDFAGGSLGECTSTTETTPLQGNGDPIPAGGLTIPTDPNDASLSVKDKTVLTVTGVPSFVGTLNWHLCGPTAADSTALCETGGVDVGSQGVTAGGTYNSPTATVTSAGRYCWRANFTSTTDGVPPSSDSRASECFIVKPVTPTLATQAGAGPVDFGQPVTDEATLTGTAHKPGTGGPTGSNGSINPTTLGGDATGTITFTLYKANCTTVATGTGQNPQTKDVTGDGTYGPVSFTPDAPGTYHWVASYSGDSPNTNATSHNSACDDTNEDVVVRQIGTDIKSKQSWTPNDTATVSAESGNLVAGGKVLFELFTNATCSGSSVYSEEVSVPGGNTSAQVGTNNTTYTITTGYADPADSTVGKHSWRVTYTPAGTDTAHTGSRSTCDSEHFNITYTNDNGPGTDLP